MTDDLVRLLNSFNRCRQCECIDCESAGIENHDHVCTNGINCALSATKLRRERQAMQVVAVHAADRIEELEADNAILREVLDPFAKYLDRHPFDTDNKGYALPSDTEPGWTYLTAGDFRRAREALKGGE